MVWTLLQLLAKLYHDYYCQRIEAVTFDYGQRHGSAEIGSAVLIGDTYNIQLPGLRFHACSPRAADRKLR